jgi:hypothetical protein
MKKFLSLFIIPLFLSCEGETTAENYIQNNSSTSIIVYAETSIVGEINAIVQPGEQYLLFTTVNTGGTENFQDPTGYIDSLYVTNLSLDTLQKDHKLSTNWGFVAEETRKAPSTWMHINTFIVTDSDF